MLIGHLSLKNNKCLYSSVEKVDFFKKWVNQRIILIVFFFFLQEDRRLNIILCLIVSFEPQSRYHAPLLSKSLGPASRWGLQGLSMTWSSAVRGTCRIHRTGSSYETELLELYHKITGCKVLSGAKREYLKFKIGVGNSHCWNLNVFPGRSGRSNSSTYRVKIQRGQNMMQKMFRKEIKIWRTEPRDLICEN